MIDRVTEGLSEFRDMHVYDVALFINGSSTFQSGGSASWWAMTIGSWKQLTWTLPTGLDLSAITSWGLNIYEGAPAVCQPMTIEVDSMLFQ